MRVSDDRYTRDRQRLDLALRLIRHEARTFTIRQWTGLSDDRIRKLYRSYVLDARCARACCRHRGKSPRQAAFFFRNSELNFQAAQLASLFVVYGLLCGTVLGLESRYRVGLARVGRSALPGLRGVPRAARAREHLLRACVVPAARARAARRARHCAMRRVRRSAAARSAGEAPTRARIASRRAPPVRGDGRGGTLLAAALSRSKLRRSTAP